MTLLDNYRSSTEYREILRILQRSSAKADNLLWQTSDSGKTIIPVAHMEIDFVSREVVVTFDKNSFVVNENCPLYVKLDYRTSVFKVDDFRQLGNTVQFTFPQLIKTQELRDKPRHLFKPAQDRFGGVKSFSGSELKVRIMDISQQGLGLIVSEQNRTFFKNNKILWITSLQGEPLDNPILGEVIYINSEVDPKFQMRKQKDIKVGIRLSDKFLAENLNQFLQ
jgi:hypothetical protein